MTIPTLPGLEIVHDVHSLYGNPREIHLDCLTRFPEAVLHGMRRELEKLERAFIPAFAEGRRVWTPNGSYQIDLNGQPSRWIQSVADFDARARRAAKRMATDTGYSFNHSFVLCYLQEDTTHA